MTERRSEPQASRLPLLGILGFAAAVGVWNAAHYPPGRGYDAAAHMSYADGLIPHLRLPHGTGEFHVPPGFYAVAGTADWLGRQLGLGEPHRVLQAVNVVLLIAGLVAVWSTGRLLWPTRPHVATAATAFLAFLPGMVRVTAMFHPELLDFVLSTCAAYIAARLLGGPRAMSWAVGLGAALGAGQLVRAFTLWTAAAVAVALAYARRWRELATVLLVAAVIPAPWYVHQAVTYGNVFAFNRPAPSTPLLDRRPASFYIGLGVPDVVTAPFRGHFVNQAVPTAYSELWGDYFGFWRWDGTHMTPGARHALSRQAVIGLLPTILAVLGAGLLLLEARRDMRKLPVALLAPVALLGFVYFTVANPSPDGDVIKGTYMLTAAGGWAMGFGALVDRLRGPLRAVILTALALAAAADVLFLVYR